MDHGKMICPGCSNIGRDEQAVPRYAKSLQGWLFDETYQTRDTEKMLWIYETLVEDYNMRGDGIFYQIYEMDDAKEEAFGK